MKIAALDMSLSAAGYKTWDKLGVIRVKSRGMQRLQEIRDTVAGLIKGADLVVIEGYSYGSKGRAGISLAELGGVIRLLCHETGRPYVEVSPNTLKKYAVGSGLAKKTQMVAAAIRRLDYQGADDNEADATWLYTAAADVYGTLDAVEMPVAQRKALRAIEWPIVYVEVAGEKVAVKPWAARA